MKLEGLPLKVEDKKQHVIKKMVENQEQKQKQGWIGHRFQRHRKRKMNRLDCIRKQSEVLGLDIYNYRGTMGWWVWVLCCAQPKFVSF